MKINSLWETKMIELMEIQQELKVPKGQKNNFGNYKYRSCEDILEAVKPLLKSRSCTLVLSDDIVEICGRVYVKATVCLMNSGEKAVQVCAFAREQEFKKGMDQAQITGSTSSYARKYAVQGLFAIDCTVDPDGHDNSNIIYDDISAKITWSKTRAELDKIYKEDVKQAHDMNAITDKQREDLIVLLTKKSSLIQETPSPTKETTKEPVVKS